jgi:hypothetical protein
MFAEARGGGKIDGGGELVLGIGYLYGYGYRYGVSSSLLCRTKTGIGYWLLVRL